MLAEYKGASRDLNGALQITFTTQFDQAVLDNLERLKGKPLEVDVKQKRNKRSLNANAYFWKLCDGLAQALGTDKDSIYLWLIEKYGVFDDVDVIADAVPILRGAFRHTQLIYESFVDGKRFVCVRCYSGSHTYDTKQMSLLINGAVYECQQTGVETLTPDEITRLINAWTGGHNERIN